VNFEERFTKNKSSRVFWANTIFKKTLDTKLNSREERNIEMKPCVSEHSCQYQITENIKNPKNPLLNYNENHNGLWWKHCGQNIYNIYI